MLWASSSSSSASRSTRSRKPSGRWKPCAIFPVRARWYPRRRAESASPGARWCADDMLLIAEGDRVPADARSAHCNNLSVDESLLTGESVPVRKSRGTEEPAEMARPGGDDLPFVYSGTLVVQGQGIARGHCHRHPAPRSAKSARPCRSLKPKTRRCRRRRRRLVRNLAIVGLALCVLVVVVYRPDRAATGCNGFLAGITLAMATCRKNSRWC